MLRKIGRKEGKVKKTNLILCFVARVNAKSDNREKGVYRHESAKQYGVATNILGLFSTSFFFLQFFLLFVFHAACLRPRRPVYWPRTAHSWPESRAY